MALPSENDTKLWLALLHEIDAAGGKVQPKASGIYLKLRGYFPDISDDDLKQITRSGTNKWTNIIQWARQRLVDRGCIDNTAPGTWVLTNAGKHWLASNWQGATADYSQVKKPPIVKKTQPPPPVGPSNKTNGTRKHPTSSPGKNGVIIDKSVTLPPPVQLSSLPDPAQQLCQKLRAAQRMSNAPQQFEQHLAEAFTFLGFDAQHIGGPGETDIFVAAALGQASYSVVVDAKSTQFGKVSDAQINWPVIDSHRQAHGATFAAVVGEDFSGGKLQTFANQYKVALITTDLLCQLLQLHTEAPFNLRDFRDLFAVTGRADSVLQALIERHRRNISHWWLITEIIDTIDKFQRANPGGSAPKIDNLHFHFMLQSSPTSSMAPTLQDVADAVVFLASPAVNILAEVPGSGGAYQLTMTPATARSRLRALARFVEGSTRASSSASSAETASNPAGTNAH